MNDFRRCGQGTERRRRMMQDEGLGTEPEAPASTAGDGPSPRAQAASPILRGGYAWQLNPALPISFPASR